MRLHSRPLGRGGRAVLLAAGGIGLLQLAGCAQPNKPQSAPVGAAAGNSGPIVISTMPLQDAEAYDQSERKLAAADWKIMNRTAPSRPWIGQVNNHDKQEIRREAEEGYTASSQSREFGSTEGAAATTQSATTRPSAVARTPSTAPAAKGAASTGVRRDQFGRLPVTVLQLPSDQLQLIWNLRNIGGTSVNASLDQGASRRRVTVKPPDLGPLVTVIQARLGKDGTVLPLPDKNALVITCNQALEEPVIELLSRLDMPRPQVNITAKIFETSHDFDYQQGARMLLKHVEANGTQSILSTFDTQRLLDRLAGGAVPYQGSVMGLLQTFGDSGISLDASIQLMAETGLISVVSSPRMTVATGETGYMLAGQEMPIQSSQVLAGNQLQISTSYKPVGVQLYITPEAAGEDSVKLHLITVVSSVQGFAPLPTLSGNNDAAMLVNPIIKSREAETVVTTRPGETLVISGMKMIRSITRENKIPILGDIPLVGDLFKNHRSQQEATDLYFFITPTLASAE